MFHGVGVHQRTHLKWRPQAKRKEAINNRFDHFGSKEWPLEMPERPDGVQANRKTEPLKKLMVWSSTSVFCMTFV
ncbi:hypothetical protein [Prochlorococcus sp. MIT 1201]|uniref:hypothetical protein n=1 Tax=Prochlorococcus sp. MIT 1201 TaxID=3082535 RepID=UPI0039A740D7